MRRRSLRRDGIGLSMRERLRRAHTEVVMLRANAYEVREAYAVRWYGKCPRCQQERFLQTSHIYPVGKYPRSRFDPDNAVALCGPCHLFWWHKHPIEAAEWIRERLGAMHETLNIRVRGAGTPDYGLQLLALEREIDERRKGTRA